MTFVASPLQRHRLQLVATLRHLPSCPGAAIIREMASEPEQIDDPAVACNRFHRPGAICFACQTVYRLIYAFAHPGYEAGVRYSYESCVVSQTSLQFCLDHEDLDWPLWAQEHQRTIQQAQADAQRAWEATP